MRDLCFMTLQPPCFIQLARFGDIIQMLPAFKALKERTGNNPIVVVSPEYAPVFDGVSYVTPWVMSLPWPSGVAQARGLARVEYPKAVVLQFWNDSKAQYSSEVGRQTRVIQCAGEKWCVDAERWPDYGTAMWSRAGFSREEMLTLPLSFDCRDADREARLAKLSLHPRRPNLLINWSGTSSPFPYTPEFQGIMAKYRDRLSFVDLNAVRAERIYDLLGLYDRSVGLVTIDTATLHLAPAAKLPYIAFTRSDWSGSVPKGHCVLQIGYNEAMKRIHDFERTLKSWVTIQMKTKPMEYVCQ